MKDLNTQYSWLVTGVCGFIGSNIAEFLLNKNQIVIGVDNCATGYLKNISSFKENSHFTYIEEDICSDSLYSKLKSQNIDFILHQAALGSVPRSIEKPIDSHQSNVDGFIKILDFARLNKIKKFVFASSSAVYGDDTTLPKIESKTGNLLSPYAATKFINEVYAATYFKTYNYPSIGLRYFNIYGKGQDPNGAYSAVIPKWINLLINNTSIDIFGDGNCSTRDYCHVTDVAKANILAALSDFSGFTALNIGTGESTNLNQLSEMIAKTLKESKVDLPDEYRKYSPKRAGDIEYSVADNSKAAEIIGFKPSLDLDAGLRETIKYYL